MAPRLNGPTCSRSTRSARSAPSRCGVSALSPRRRVSRRRIACSSNRRSANASALAEDGSSHWSSSIARTTGPRRQATRARSGRDTERAGIEVVGIFLDEERRLQRMAPGCRQRRQDAPRTCSNRSPRPAWVNLRSASAGRETRTRNPQVRAPSTPACQRGDFPMPGSPSSTKARGPSAARSRNTSIDRARPACRQS